ncbi:MAG: C39 family peptidase [Chloroflexi bacterium]|nr:C39 family peptidase [Chloroflexota bacterium]
MPLLSVSHQQQKQQSDCLAACASMVLDYLRIRVEYTRLLRLLRIGPIGAAFGNLTALETLGVSVLVDEGRSVDDITNHLLSGLPVVVFLDTAELVYWNYEHTDHATVVIGIENGQVILNDPEFSNAPQYCSVGEFELAWMEKDNLFAVISLA